MKKQLIGVFALLLMISCDDYEPPLREARDFCSGGGNCAAEIHENRYVTRIMPVEHSQPVLLIDGEKVVFEYRFEPDMEPGATDIPPIQFIYVQVDPSAESFEYIGTIPEYAAFYTTLENTLPQDIDMFNQTCLECPKTMRGWALHQGTLAGRKLSDSRWRIEGVVTLKRDGLPDEKVIVNAEFTK